VPLTKPPANAVAAVGMALLFTPGLFVTASVLKYVLGVGFLYDALAGIFSSRAFDRASPALLLGGLAIALALNVYAVADLSLRRGQNAGTGRVRVARRVANLIVIAGSALLLTVLLGYLLVENAA
jgi:hypothetical protein